MAISYMTVSNVIAAITASSGIVDLVRCTLNATFSYRRHKVNLNLPASELPSLPEGSDRHKH